LQLKAFVIKIIETAITKIGLGAIRRLHNLTPEGWHFALT